MSRLLHDSCQESCQYHACKYYPRFCMILVSILLARITQVCDIILVRFWHYSCKESCQYLACKNYPRFWHDSCQYPSCKYYPRFWYDFCQDCDMIFIKNHVTNWNNSCQNSNTTNKIQTLTTFLSRMLSVSCLQILPKILI